MSKIIWNTEVNAPCCPGEILNADDESQSVKIQTDWDFPGVASTFGWSMDSVQVTDDDGEESEYCNHRDTDGTVDCPVCKITTSQFIESARKWLEDHDGAMVEDPGYFV
jgi:hypothetical protein